MNEINELRERLAKAEAELAKLREQEPTEAVAYRIEWPDGLVELAWQPDGYDEDYIELRGVPIATPLVEMLVAAPVPAPAAPAPEILDGDDFNGTTPHLIQCIEALVRMNDCGVLVPHGIGSHARTLLLASANRLRQQPAPSVPEGCLKCWLIESPASSEWPAIWLTITTDGRRWVSDGGTMYSTGCDWYFTTAASEALKFADKESADEYVRHNKIKNVAVTEHIFEARALLQSATSKDSGV